MYPGRNTVIPLMVKGKPKEDPDENEHTPLAFDSLERMRAVTGALALFAC